MLSDEEKSCIQQEWLAEEERLEAQELADAIARLVDEFGQLPEDINNGNCEAFADMLVDRLGYGIVRWHGDDASPAEARDVDGVHCFAEIDGRYYDSERPDGVDDWRDLPCFERSRKWREHLASLRAANLFR